MKGLTLNTVLDKLLGRKRPPEALVAASVPVPPPTPAEPAVAPPIVSSGVVVQDADVSDEYPGAVRRTVPEVAHELGTPIRDIVLNVFEAGAVATSTIYLPMDLARGRLFVNQTYQGVLRFWGPRPVIADGRYSFRADTYETVTRRVVVIGGPIDGNYYHWMLNWLPRVAILKMLRPDILADPSVALFVDWQAKASPYIDFLHAIGIGEERLVWADHTKDYLLKDAVLVSFGGQHATPVPVAETMREMFAPLGRSGASPARSRRLWISRQGLGGPMRRRIHNIEEVRPVFEAHGLEEVTLEGRPVAEQIALFQNADFIASVHGAGLTNILFSPPGCKVLSLDSGPHIRFGATLIYEALAKACGLTYASLRVKRAPLPPGETRSIPNMHHQDLIVPPAKLDAILTEMLGGG